MYRLSRIVARALLVLSLVVLSVFVPAMHGTASAQTDSTRLTGVRVNAGWRVNAGAAVDSVAVDSVFHMTKSPTTAVLLSAALPGAGQIYLHQWWKAPIIWALGGAFGGAALYQNAMYRHWLDSGAMRLARHDTAGANDAGRIREIFRDDRDKWWIYLGLTYVANLLDAYISANLYDFDVSTPAPTEFSPAYDPTTNHWEMDLRIHF